MSKLIRFRVTLDCDDFSMPFIEVIKLMDSLFFKSNIALYFSRAIVPDTELVLSEYAKKYEAKILKKKGYEKSDYIVIFKNIKSNLELLKLMEQHGLNLYYISAEKYENYNKLENIFSEKDNGEIDYKLFNLSFYKILVYFDIDRTIDISFNPTYFNKPEALNILENWFESMIVNSFNLEELQ